MKYTKPKKHKILCPFCGHPTSVMADENAVCKGVYVKCKGALQGQGSVWCKKRSN